MSENDLELVETQDLVRELLHRCEHGVVGLLFTSRQNQLDYMYRWTGGIYESIGLAHDLGSFLSGELRQRTGPWDPRGT